MPEFLRARSPEQKIQRLTEIKNAADSLFMQGSYHDITLSTIADRLTWTRANLYRYVDTKEDILLEITEDKMNDYYDALLETIPAGSSMSYEKLADIWADTIDSNRPYMIYNSIMPTIIETNVSVERLATFKKAHKNRMEDFACRLHEVLGIELKMARMTLMSVDCHSMGLIGYQRDDEKLEQAYKIAGICRTDYEFKSEMRRFILMNLEYAASH